MTLDRSQESPAEDPAEAALTRALRQPSLPAESIDRLRAAVSSEWQRAAGAPRRRSQQPAYRLGLAAAAVFLCVVAGWWIAALSTPGAVVGVVPSGDPRGLTAERRWRSDLPLGPGAAVRVGQRLSAARTTAVTLEGGGSLLLKAGSAVTVSAAHEIELRQGTLYVDMDPAHVHDELTIHTPFGSVRHVGTQFQVSLVDAVERVLVREGMVRISGAVSMSLEAGQALKVDRRGGTAIQSISPSDDAWQWTESAIDSLDVDGQTAMAFLRWYARITGRHVDFADPSAKDVAGRTVLHGSIHHLSPDLILHAVLATTSLAVEINETSIRVSTAVSVPTHLP